MILEERPDTIEQFEDELAQDFGPSSPIAEATRRKRKRSPIATTLQGKDVVETQLVRGHAANIPHCV